MEPFAIAMDRRSSRNISGRHTCRRRRRGGAARGRFMGWLGSTHFAACAQAGGGAVGMSARIGREQVFSGLGQRLA